LQYSIECEDVNYIIGVDGMNVIIVIK